MLVDIAQVLVLALCAGGAVFVTTLCLRGWRSGEFLCTECKYNDPEMCNKAERPKALVCAAFSQRPEPKP